MLKFPLTWAALNVTLVSAATYLLCNSDALSGAATGILLFH